MRGSFFTVAAVAIAAVLLYDTASAIPPFARKYQTSCSTCHYAYPKLNGFGKAFKNNGLRYPGDDEAFVKDEPTSLGSEAYKRVFPDAVWPSDIPGTPPIGVRFIGRFSYYPNARNEGGIPELGGHDEGGTGAEPTTDRNGIAETSFDIPTEAEVLFGGTFGETFSFLGHVEFEFDDEGTEISAPFQLAYNYQTWLNLSFGNVNLDPIENHQRLSLQPYNVARLRTESGFTLGEHNAGLELWGALDGWRGQGGFEYAVGVVNGTGGFRDDNSAKDVYAVVSYKLFGQPLVGGEDTTTSASSDFWRDDQIKFGGFAYKGTGRIDLTGGEVVDDDFLTLGGSIEVWYNRLILKTAYATLSTNEGESAGGNNPDAIRRSAWFLEGQYVVFPWLIPIARYEFADLRHGVNYDPSTNPDEETNLIAGMTFLPRANVKVVAEYMKPLDDHRDKADAAFVQVDFAF